MRKEFEVAGAGGALGGRGLGVGGDGCGGVMPLVATRGALVLEAVFLSLLPPLVVVLCIGMGEPTGPHDRLFVCVDRPSRLDRREVLGNSKSNSG